MNFEFKIFTCFRFVITIVIVPGDTKSVYFARVIEDALASEVTINKTKQLAICHAFCAVAGIV